MSTWPHSEHAYLVSALTLLPFLLIPSAAAAMITLLLVSIFPPRRACEALMLMGVLFVIGLVLLLRVLQPERLLRVEALPDITGFFATLQSPVTPLLPSFSAGESLFSALRGEVDGLQMGALGTPALAANVDCGVLYGRYCFSAWSKAQEARKARFTKRGLRLQLDLDRIPYMSRVVKNAYAFVNLAMAAFVLSAVAVRFVFPAVSTEGEAFWIVRSAPVFMRLSANQAHF